MKTLLRLLTEVPLEKPCDAAWSKMAGDDRVRRCDRCERDVYDLSAMTALEAEARLLNAGTRAPCIRYVRTIDGSIAHRPPQPPFAAPRRASIASAAALGLTLAASTAHATDDGKQPAQCVAYARSPAVAAMAAPAAAAPPSKTAPAPSPVTQPLAGAPPPPREQPHYGTLQLKSTQRRTVTLVGIELVAPLQSYFLTPGDFIADVKDADGKSRQVKFTIKQDKTTVVDLDTPAAKKSK